MIQLHRLEGFYRVATSGGYTRAAREFPYPISQPAVHQQVRKLEAELGCRLFERVGRDRVSLTSAGRKLFDFCAPFFEELPSIARAIAAKDFGGVLRIEAGGLELRYVLPAWIKRLRRARPEIAVELREVEANATARLLEGGIDLVVDHQESIPAGLEAERAGTHYAFLVLPAAHPATRLRRVTLAALRDEPFVGFHPAMPQFALQMRAFEAGGERPNHRLSASSTEAILAFVQAELGFSLIPWPSVDGPRVPGVRALLQRAYEFPIWAMFKRRKEADPLITALFSVLE